MPTHMMMGSCHRAAGRRGATLLWRQWHGSGASQSRWVQAAGSRHGACQLVVQGVASRQKWLASLSWNELRVPASRLAAALPSSSLCMGSVPPACKSRNAGQSSAACLADSHSGCGEAVPDAPKAVEDKTSTDLPDCLACMCARRGFWRHLIMERVVFPFACFASPTVPLQMLDGTTSQKLSIARAKARATPHRTALSEAIRHGLMRGSVNSVILNRNEGVSRGEWGAGLLPRYSTASLILIW